ncbi:ATP-binding protein [Bradyrhizobium sp. 45]|nr:ATP-binding protein [Bradyrhizobium sp. 45]MCK1296361.1 GHKL domain-containing protein [Bradyrhizobium sp. 30]MCK1325508.1 GHKL domain-containing protein [Bradyrhizobium sp. 156]MCK1352129.1 GHKL domain-containing protein [Bradyrhizobium sp. CW7]MCK1412556.1 GHKL domain-containing protein [Bradyrhizobium sp. CW4]MCK1439334.1 GHKL domain-containing protein [Bradyrhizobium sp. 15]MCK1450564.1 GHKL domain-containing protein [Bradyrhizobium sp. 35]MCK1466520.1 GHKL domain-containing protein [
MRFCLFSLSWRSFCRRTFAAPLVVALLLATLGPGRAADPEPKRVLMLQSFGLRFKPWTDFAEFLRPQMIKQSKVPIDFQDHSLLSALVDDDKALAPFIGYLQALYGAKPPDLIVALGAPAAEFVQRYRAQLFPKTPMMFTSVEARRVQYDKLTEYDTVAAAAHNFPAAIETILKVLPDTKVIAVVNGASPNETFWQGVLERELAPFSGRVELRWYNKLSFEDILKDAAHLPPHSAIFWHLMSVDAAGVTHEGTAALHRLSAAADAPIFSYLDGFFDGSIVGGSMHSIEKGMTIAAAAAIRILNGEKAGDVKVAPSQFELPRFDWRQMQRFGISDSHLPPGSTVYFREPSVWERYLWLIASVVAVFLIQAGLIAILLREHRRRQFAEVQSRQRMTELAHVNRFATAGELTASIAHEINQPLGSILTNAETAAAILQSQRPDIAALSDVVELREIVNDILQDDRRATEVIRRMRSLLKKAPFELKQLDLNEVVQETVRFLSALTVSRKFEMVNVITPDALPILGDRIQLQQVILNLVLNGVEAMKDTSHESRTISIRTARVEQFAELSVSDRGPGIPEDKLKQVFEPFYSSKAEGMGMGLSIARTIIEAHNGFISASNREHGGASFAIRLPFVA